MVPMTAAGWSIVYGLMLGVGLWSLVSAMPRMTRPRLIHRVAPYLGDVSESARSFAQRRQANPLSVFGSILGPGVDRIRDLVGPLIGSTATIELRLRQSGSTDTVNAFRSRLLVWTIAGTAAGVVVSIALSQARAVPIAVHLVVVVLAGAAGFVACDQRLKIAARRRMSRMSAELPVVLEFLTLSLSAGESILDSFRRIAVASRGELAGELGRVVAAVNSGSTLADSLQQLARGIRLPEFTRCVDQVVGALERGTPLVDVLRAQAQDAREEAKRELLEVAGKKEVAMMFPLVFLLLPVTILFAVFPGLFVLQLGF